jgi:hypothetical protein
MQSSTILQVHSHFLAIPLFLAHFHCTILAYFFPFFFHNHSSIVMWFFFYSDSRLFFAGLSRPLCFALVLQFLKFFLPSTFFFLFIHRFHSLYLFLFIGRYENCTSCSFVIVETGMMNPFNTGECFYLRKTKNS